MRRRRAGEEAGKSGSSTAGNGNCTQNAMVFQKVEQNRTADAVVRQILDGTEDVYPGRIASDLYAGWRDSHKVVERELAMGLPEPR